MIPEKTRHGGLTLLLLLVLPLCAHAQRVALTFDDGFDPREQPQAAQWNAAILEALSNAHVHTLLFAAGKRIDSPAGLALVNVWGAAGQAVGNHTYSHEDFGSPKTTLRAFIADAQRNESLLKNQPGWERRFRFPYLKEGDTAAKRDGFRRWLKSHGYQSGAVSIDASNWYYNTRYIAWRETHPTDDPALFRTAYLNHLWNRATYYESLSQLVLHRSAQHVLLLHMNRINADFLPDLIDMFRDKGWTIVSPDEAYADPLYAMTPNALPAGESILSSLANTHGFRVRRRQRR